MAQVTSKVAASSFTEGSLREFKREDIDEVARLFLITFMGKEEQPPRSLGEQYQRFFFDNPWRELNVSPSLVCTDASGAIVGFFGAHPRQFVCGDKTVTAIIYDQLMIASSMRRRGLGRKLTAAIMDGPQTLSFGTTTSLISNPIFLQLGFWNPSFATLKWNKSLGPAGGRLGRLVYPLCKLFLRRSHSGPKSDFANLSCRPLSDPTEVCTLRKTLLGAYKMRSDLEPEHMTWLWDSLLRSQENRQLQSCVLQQPDGQPVGWAVYYVTPGLTAKILELGCSPNCYDDALARLFRYLTDAGMIAAQGRCWTPELTVAVANQGAELSYAFTGTVYHCKDPEVQLALLNGEAFWSELDTESWFNFRGRCVSP